MFLLVGIVVVLIAMSAGQRDVMRIGLLLAVLPIIAGILVSRARLRMSCERMVEPAQAPLGSPMRGQIVLAQEGRLPAGILLLEDAVPRELGSRPRFLVDRPDVRWRRVVEYPLLGRVRGRFSTGPLTVRTTDPFGLVQLDRQFVATTEVMVTPRVVPLPAIRTIGGGGNTGEARPHRIGVVGQDDALVREYRQGDDVRRIHWRSTARWGDLMVRREEQAWDPSASIVLDSRESAHAGRGMHNSLEWAVSAAASIGIHFLDDGFGIEIYEADGPLHISGSMGQHSSASAELVVSRLTDLKARSTSTLQYAVESATIDRPGQLVIAILGRLTAADANTLIRVRRNRAQGLAMVLDVDTFADQPGTEQQRAQHELAEQILRDNQWMVIKVNRGTSVTEAWSAFEQLSRARMMRPTDRNGLAVMVSVALACLTLRPLTSDGSYVGLSWLLIALIGGFGMAMRRVRFGGTAVLATQSAIWVLFSLGLGLVTPGRDVPWYAHYAEVWVDGIQHMRTQASPMDPNDGTRLIFVTIVGLIMIMTDLLVNGIHRPAWALAPPATLFLVPALGLGTDTGVFSFGLIAVGYLAILVADGLNTAARWTRGLSRDSAEGFGEAEPGGLAGGGVPGRSGTDQHHRAGGRAAHAVPARLRVRHRRRRWAAAADRPDTGPATEPEPAQRPDGDRVPVRHQGWGLPEDGHPS